MSDKRTPPRVSMLTRSKQGETADQEMEKLLQDLDMARAKTATVHSESQQLRTVAEQLRSKAERQRVETEQIRIEAEQQRAETEKIRRETEQLREQLSQLMQSNRELAAQRIERQQPIISAPNMGNA